MISRTPESAPSLSWCSHNKLKSSVIKKKTLHEYTEVSFSFCQCKTYEDVSPVKRHENCDSHVCMFITAEKTGHLKTSDEASLMRTAVRAVQLNKCIQTVHNFKLNLLKWK